jgi:hypothetical protein
MLGLEEEVVALFPKDDRLQLISWAVKVEMVFNSTSVGSTTMPLPEEEALAALVEALAVPMVEVLEVNLEMGRMVSHGAAVEERVASMTAEVSSDTGAAMV